jgi:outer membrane protein OmpA-like peptidoglycan-associated protein
MLRRVGGLGGGAIAVWVAFAALSHGILPAVARDAGAPDMQSLQPSSDRTGGRPIHVAEGPDDAAVSATRPQRESKVRAVLPDPPMPTSIAPGDGWDQEVLRNSRIQAKLRNETGDRVFFSAGSAKLGSRARSALSAQAAWLNRWHEFEIAVEGHADDPGSDADNLALATRRAEAVRRRLVEEGVAPARLAIVAQGRGRRVAPCAASACTAQNRRTVTFVFATGTRARLMRRSGPVAEVVDPQPLRPAQPVSQDAGAPAR